MSDLWLFLRLCLALLSRDGELRCPSSASVLRGCDRSVSWLFDVSGVLCSSFVILMCSMGAWTANRSSDIAKAIVMVPTSVCILAGPWSLKKCFIPTASSQRTGESHEPPGLGLWLTCLSQAIEAQSICQVPVYPHFLHCHPCQSREIMLSEVPTVGVAHASKRTTCSYSCLLPCRLGKRVYHPSYLTDATRTCPESSPRFWPEVSKRRGRPYSCVRLRIHIHGKCRAMRARIVLTMD